MILRLQLFMVIQKIKYAWILIFCITINDQGETHDLPTKRYDELINLLDEVSGKVIIWATYRHNIQTITTKLKEKYGDTSTAAFYGDTENQVRMDLVKNFQDEEHDLTYLVANPKTGGYGITLTASHTVVYFSNNYDLEIRLQSSIVTGKQGT